MLGFICLHNAYAYHTERKRGTNECAAKQIMPFATGGKNKYRKV